MLPSHPSAYLANHDNGKAVNASAAPCRMGESMKDVST